VSQHILFGKNIESGKFLTMDEENYFVRLFKKTFINLYEVTLELSDGDTRTFQLSRVDTLNKHYVKGLDGDNLRLEFFSKEPFTYTLRQLY